MHLVLISQAKMRCECGCGDTASRFIRCRKCQKVIALCGVAGNDMERVRGDHEARCS